MTQIHDIGLTPAIVRQFGIAFGLWGYNMDIAMHGRAQSENPDLVAVEESDIYAEVMKAIEMQDPPEMVKREIAGKAVWVEEKPSELYTLMREAMFEAYRRAAQIEKSS